MRPVLISVFILLSVQSCRQDNKLTQEEKLRIADTVALTLINYANDVKAKGLTAEFNYLDSSSDFFWVPPGFSSAISYDSVASILNQSVSHYKTVDNTYVTLKVLALSRRLATYHARINSVITDNLGKVSVMKLMETGLLIKRPNGWKLQSGHTTILTP